MGGIMKRMKLTSLTFIIATMALIAIPFTSGFFSKEAILEAALRKNPVFFWIGAGVALLTTFYMMRVIFVVFFGKSRSHSSEHASEVGGLMLVPLLILAVRLSSPATGSSQTGWFLSTDSFPKASTWACPSTSPWGRWCSESCWRLPSTQDPRLDKLSGNAVSGSRQPPLY